MKPDRYEVSPPGRERLSGVIETRGTKTVGTWIGFLFGIPFVVAGVAILLISLDVLKVNPSSIHAPRWVLGVAGSAFLFGGLMVWGMAANHCAANRRAAKARREFPHEPALADYPWNRQGFEVSEWSRAAKTTAAAIGATVFLSMFNWWAFAQDAPLMVKFIVSIFDLAAAGLWWMALRQIGRGFKFGRSRVIFTQFPYSVGERVLLRWQPMNGVSQILKGTFTLRCVEERVERTRSGAGKQTTQIVHEKLWSAAWAQDKPRNLLMRDQVELEYHLPPDAHGTDLGATRPIFWELDVKLELPGLDFRAAYLIPIYARSPQRSRVHHGLRNERSRLSEIVPAPRLRENDLSRIKSLPNPFL